MLFPASVPFQSGFLHQFVARGQRFNSCAWALLQQRLLVQLHVGMASPSTLFMLPEASKLDGSNFSMWSLKMKSALIGAKLWDWLLDPRCASSPIVMAQTVSSSAVT